MQSIGFLITWHWYLVNDIDSSSAACFAQGWMIHSGDLSRFVHHTPRSCTPLTLSSGFFVLAIAMHTYFTAVHGGRLSQSTFNAIIAAIWTLAFLLTVIGVGLHTDKYFEKAGEHSKA